VLLQHAAPYRQASTAFTAVVASVLLLCMLIVAMLVQMYDTLPYELIMDYFGFESVLPLAAIIFSFTVVVLAVALALCLYQLWVENHKYVARRLRYRDGSEVQAPRLGNGEFHLFLSHVWASGQDQMRICKKGLLELVPELRIFLDVDITDLDLSKLEDYVARSGLVLIFCSQGYFASRNCLRELRSAVLSKKPLIALMEPEADHGWLTMTQVRMQLLLGTHDAHLAWPWVGNQTVITLQTSYEKWGFGWPPTPKPADLHSELFKEEAIEWNRLSVMQDVTLRLIAERVVVTDKTQRGKTYAQGELAQLPSRLRALSRGHAYHLYCSPCNEGAETLLRELAKTRSLSTLKYTNQFSELQRCEAMLLYLTGRTWTRGMASDEFAEEVEDAMRSGMRLVLAHEMPGLGQNGRHAVEFKTFFAADQTPDELKRAGIYSTIAVPLKGGAWRETSMALLAKELATTAKATDYAFGASAQDTPSMTTAVRMDRTISRRASRPGVGEHDRARLRGLSQRSLRQEPSHHNFDAAVAHNGL